MFRKSLLGGIIICFVLFWLWLTPAAFAVESVVDFSADTNIELTSQGKIVSVVVESGSKAESFEVSATSTTMTIELGTGGDSFTIKDTVASRRMLFLITGGNHEGLKGTCDSTQSSYTITNTATTTYTIAPRADSTCTTSVPAGGGGGGGSASTPAPAPSPAPAPAPSPAPAPTPAPAPAPSTAGAHANGTLILDNGTIYLVVNGKKRGFRNPEEYFSHGYKFEQAVPANDTDKSLALEAQPVEKALDGTLALDKTDNRTIYMIAAGKKRGFTSAEVFFALGYKFEQALAIDLNDYAAGDPITSADTPHPDGALVLEDTGTVWWILAGKRQGFQSAEVFFTYGFTFEEVVGANAADMALSEGPLVKFRDGTIVKDGDAYFLISEGQKRRFASLEAMEQLGYKASNAISASLASYAEGAAIN